MKFVDLRFTDTRGKEQHVTIPAQLVDEDLFARRQDVRRLVDRRLEGHQRVGHDPDARARHRRSSIRSSKRPRVNIRCDVHRAGRRMQGYERDPRSLAKRAEAYLKSTGIADTALLRPRARVLHLRLRALGNDMRGAFYEIDSVQGAWNSRQGVRRTATRATAPASRAATSRCRRSMRSRTCARRCAWRSRSWASRSKCTTTRWRPPASARSASVPHAGARRPTRCRS